MAAGAPPPGSDARRRMPAARVALLLAAGVALIFAGAWYARQWHQRASEAVRVLEVLEAFRQDLPREFAPGLVLEQVAFEDRVLVMTLRAPKRQVGDGSEAERAAVRQAEKELMLPLCDSADVRFLLARGHRLKRRFIDAGGRVFFEIELGADDCARYRTGVMR